MFARLEAMLERMERIYWIQDDHWEWERKLAYALALYTTASQAGGYYGLHTQAHQDVGFG